MKNLLNNLKDYTLEIAFVLCTIALLTWFQVDSNNTKNEAKQQALSYVNVKNNVVYSITEEDVEACQDYYDYLTAQEECSSSSVQHLVDMANEITTNIESNSVKALRITNFLGHVSEYYVVQHNDKNVVVQYKDGSFSYRFLVNSVLNDCSGSDQVMEVLEESYI